MWGPSLCKARTTQQCTGPKGLWSDSVMPPTVTVNVACPWLKGPLMALQFSVKPLSPRHTPTHPIFLSHTDPRSQKTHAQPNTHESADITSRMMQPHKALIRELYLQLLLQQIARRLTLSFQLRLNITFIG